jgi:hypothetical protein
MSYYINKADHFEKLRQPIMAKKEGRIKKVITGF